jgi:hypothetical protein
MKVISKNQNLFSSLSSKVSGFCPSISLYDGEEIPVGAGAAVAASVALRSTDLVEKFIDKQAKHWVQNNEGWFEKDLLQAGHFCENPASYFQECSSILNSNSLAQHSIFISSKDEKPRLKEEVQNFAQGTQSQNAMDSAHIIAEELYMNAILDAPREAQKLGFPNYDYTGQLCARMELSRCSDKLVMSMADPFGSLDCWKFIKRMNQVYKKGAGEVLNRGPGGAGLGCVILFENSAALFLGVEPQRVTKVTCVIPVGMSNGQRDKIGKSLHRIDLGPK